MKIQKITHAAQRQEEAEVLREEFAERRAALVASQQKSIFSVSVRVEMQELLILEAALATLLPDAVPFVVPAMSSSDLFRPTEAQQAQRGEKVKDEQRTVDKEDNEIEKGEVDWVILPPDAMERAIVPGSMTDEWMERLGAPRVDALRMLLDDMKYSYREVVGEVDATSMRDTPYHAFILPELGRIVFVNDKYGEATFVVVQREYSFKQLSQMTKRALRKFLGSDARRISYPGDLEKWRAIVEHYLTNQPEPETHIGKDYLTPKGILRILKTDYGIGFQDAVLVGLFEKMRTLPAFADLPYRRERAEVGRTGNTLYEYDPEFVEKAIDLLVVLSKPNDQWKTLSGVTDVISEQLTTQGREGVDNVTVDNTLQELLGSPEAETKAWKINRYLGTGGVSVRDQQNNLFNLRTHYSPELCSAVTEKMIRETAPLGWKTVNAIAEEISLRPGGKKHDVDRIEGTILRFQREQPEHFSIGNFRDSGVNRRQGKSKILKLFADPALAEEVITFFSKKK